MAIKLDEYTVEHAVYGGAVLGGGGGGKIADGLQIGRLALEIGHPILKTAEEMEDEDLLVTVSLVGAPAAKEQYVKPMHYIKAIDLLSQAMNEPIRGIITNENGASTTVNGWFQSAVTGLPVVDIPCNGRAHPTGIMGSLNLSEQAGFISHQAAVGGRGERFLELSISSSLDIAASTVRQLSVEAGGLVAVARNPVPVAYAKKHGASGAIQQAIQVGEALCSHKGEAAIDSVVALLGGKVIAEGTVTDFVLETTGGFDVGTVTINKDWSMSFWNEYMTIEKDGIRYGTFPDLIMTLDAKTGRPVVTAEVEKGQNLAVIIVPKEKLILSSTMRNHSLMCPIEKIIGKQIINYL
ncbi:MULTISPECIES: DUF917 family protein [Bacillaceae]|uniref:DUF917 domain-containing protein n=1 Tax=Bacillaceae TaxID=186817 RepID=UPI001E594235|nr:MULTISPECIES: DUF917 family protein [Bacillaceae]MCE4049810.1 DUF917 family protein [Bacillus sp. Au-Bac7]MCM3032268.1 DUF917 family protein [Niallia sp. MER 6]MDL0435380.1 DUF917 family protein [Niallia sp. SS-2023]UPO87572.1 DUF917 family protein [Niallia sp. Man26]